MSEAADPQATLQLSARLLEAAQAADWERVAGLQAACDEQVRRPWPAGVGTRDAYRMVQERYAGVLALVAQARDQIGQDLGRLQESHRALNAYLDIGSAG